MIFVRLELINGRYEAKLTHYMPFHPTYGLGKTEEELLLEGVLVESLPPLPPREEGQYLKLMAYYPSKELYYEVGWPEE